MKRAACVVLLLCLLAAGLAACVVPGDRAPAGASAGGSHECAQAPVVVGAGATVLAYLPSTGYLIIGGGLLRLQRRPSSPFQPPEPSS